MRLQSDSWDRCALVHMHSVMVFLTFISVAPLLTPTSRKPLRAAAAVVP